MSKFNLGFDILSPNFEEQIGKFHQHLEKQKTDSNLMSIDDYVDNVVFDKKTAISELAEMILTYEENKNNNLLIKQLVDEYIKNKREIFFAAREMMCSMHTSVLLDEATTLVTKNKSLLSTNKDLKTLAENINMLDHMHKLNFVRGVKLKEDKKH